MSSEFNKRFSDILVSCPDIIEVQNDNGYGVNEYAFQSQENGILPYAFVMEHHLKQCNDDTSTIMSDSLFESSTDHNCFESQLAVKTSAFPLQNIGQSKRSNENPGKISIEHSSDVLIGSKTFFTGPVVIKQFIAESDAANAQIKEEYSDVLGTSEIGNNFPSLSKWFQ